MKLFLRKSRARLLPSSSRPPVFTGSIQPWPWIRLLLLAALPVAMSEVWSAEPVRPVPVVARPGFARDLWAPFVEPDFPFFSSVADFRNHRVSDWPQDNLTARGLVLNLGSGCWAVFDIDLLRISAIWEGAGLTPVSMARISYNDPEGKAPPGESNLPQLQGEPWLLSGLFPGWSSGPVTELMDPRTRGVDPRETGRGALPSSRGRFKSVRLIREGVCLEYEVGAARILETIEARRENGVPSVQRSIRIEGMDRPLSLIAGRIPAAIAGSLRFEMTASLGPDGQPLADWHGEIQRYRVIEVRPGKGPVEFAIRMTRDEGEFFRDKNLRSEPMVQGAQLSRPSGNLSVSSVPDLREGRREESIRFMDGRPWNVPHLSAPLKPALTRWPSQLFTRARLAAGDRDYVVDNIPLPWTNPWRRNLRFADLAFFKDGRAVAVTFDGDVWMITGLGGDLDRVGWTRYASGLHEPMSIGVRDGQVFVFDRNGLWRLIDSDGNGEADTHELFSGGFAQTAETREYAQGMRIAPDGSFILAKGGIQASALGIHNGCVLKVSPDGQKIEVLGHGFRSPFVGVHPVTGLVTASDQQGNYVPTTPIHVVEGNQFYGFLSNLLPREKYPGPIAEPLLWIPYPVNASGGSQVWLTGARMGALNDQMVHVGYFRPELFLVLMNSRGRVPQGAVVSLTRDFEFAPLNAAVNPADGQLYVIGLQIWGSQASQISGLARLRHTGRIGHLPLQAAAFDQGVLLEFGVELDPVNAVDPAGFSVERWNYRRTPEYGSPHFKLDGSKGQETLVPSRVYLSADRRKILVAIPDMKTSMQLRIGWSISDSKGARMEQNAYLTPRELTTLNAGTEGFGSVKIDLTPRISEPAREIAATPEEGRRLAELMGCAACHSADGSVLGKSGPTWKGLFGSMVPIAGGREVRADEAYLRESILSPAAKIVRGYEKTDTAMPSYEGVLTELQINALLAYIRTQ